MPRINFDRLYIAHKRKIITTAISMMPLFLFSGELHNNSQSATQINAKIAHRLVTPNTQPWKYHIEVSGHRMYQAEVLTPV